jgi:hypothetical protein
VHVAPVAPARRESAATRPRKARATAPQVGRNPPARSAGYKSRGVRGSGATRRASRAPPRRESGATRRASRARQVRAERAGRAPPVAHSARHRAASRAQPVAHRARDKSARSARVGRNPSRIARAASPRGARGSGATRPRKARVGRDQRATPVVLSSHRYWDLGNFSVSWRGFRS